MIQHYRELLTSRFDTPDQAFLTRTLSQPLGRLVAVGAYRFGASPNVVTLLGLFLMLAAASVYASGEGVPGSVWAVILFQLGFAFDCADGQLARATRRQSPFGAWLDVSCDHVRQGCTCLALTMILPGVAGYCCVALLLAGLSVYLHTVMSLKIAAPAQLNLTGNANRLRKFLKECLDTPVFLFLLCVLRGCLDVLMVYVACYGLLSLMRAASLARLRLGHP